MKRTLILPVIIALATLTGCPSAGIYRSAKTLEKGESDFGMSFSYVNIKTKYTGDDPDLQGAESYGISLPNLIPELNYHIGVGNNMEVGGRIALGSLMMELDFKYRFYTDGKLHMAVQPAVGYRTAVIVKGTHFTMPLLMTYELSDMVSLNAFVYSSYIKWEPTDGTPDPDSDDNAWFVEGVTLGGGFGVKITGENFYIMPAIDFSRLVVSTNGDRSDWVTDFVIFGVSFGWIGGKEMKKLKEMDHKLDRIENKIDRM
ncbi:hypothetical protein KKF34_00510 [Myxococcota bacterium]|nr:hypothetical protein [Myxococcota bacterium]MBU1380218.1 hypothetical protein [Myxococcota bacterium]MBU1495343.1 hypothetical protein [Myxococcota bacterium]